MSFQYVSRHQEEYHAVGYTLLRDVIPASLLAELRVEAENARGIARKQNGPQCQRLQPIYTFEEVNAKPFRDFLELPALRQAVEGCLGAEHETSDMMGVLLEPAQEAWCTDWHRDWNHHIPGLNPHSFDEASDNMQMLNHLNAALYSDHSLWVVPGSHNRVNTEAEQSAISGGLATAPVFTTQAIPAARELACIAYARKMPGGVQTHLEAGDVFLYHSSLWHCGVYVPYVKRATLHDGFACGGDMEIRNRIRFKQDAAQSMPEPLS